MCGIFGYTGSKQAIDEVLAGLKRLEYRGYDSAGIAGIQKGKLVYCKEVGKLNALETELRVKGFESNIVIGHTRWATHGSPTKINAHPHLNAEGTLAVVHNGIIENHAELRHQLKEAGFRFLSDTDTEVIAMLLGRAYQGDLLAAVQQVIPLLEGAYALAILHQDHPHSIVAVANQAPLSIGIGNQENYISSDSHAFSGSAHEAIYLSNGEIALITPEKVEIFNAENKPIQKERQLLSRLCPHEEVTKEGYEHFTLKEIYQQPQTIRNALASRLVAEYGNATFDDTHLDMNELMSAERVLILACGTSWHAGLIGACLLEDLARIPVAVEISSEFRYKNPIILHGTYVIAISQSGETADTIAAVREVKAKGAHVLGICNVPGSTLARESDACIFLRAGPEIGVCSTKAFTSQVIILALFTLLMGRMRHMTKENGQRILQAINQLPEQVQQVLDRSPQIQALAKKYAHFDNFFFMGRRYMFPTGLEGALKLKEISYINANGYAAGEMKHGAIALLNENCPVIALCANKSTFSKLESNLRESKARHAPLIAVAEENGKEVHSIADDVILVPHTIDELAVIPTTVALQLFAYYVAKERGADIDQPRNLAKSVTVE